MPHSSARCTGHHTLVARAHAALLAGRRWRALRGWRVRLRGVPGDLRCTVAVPSSLVLPTPVLSEVPSLSWPTTPFHRAPQGPQRWPTGCWIPWAQANNDVALQGPQPPGLALWVPDPLRALIVPQDTSGALLAHWISGLPSVADPPVGSLSLLDGSCSCCVKWCPPLEGIPAHEVSALRA